jgi:nitrous oxidase accessory protein NosD
MKFRATLLATLVCLIAIASFAGSSAAKTLLVDVNRVACPTAGYTSIQAAVTAASPGDTIRICPGVYVEQVSIDKSLTLSAENGAILMPSSLQSNSTSLYDGSPLAVALLVTNTTGVTISGLIVDGTNNAISDCAPDLFGIAFQNASGTIEHSTVRNFKSRRR